jgi:Mrp family chromosome partitioning ATPase/capsular polysaccharide biosynthesis protein
MTLRDYLAVLWRRKWFVVAVVVAATAAAFFFAWRQTPQYAATSTLIYEQQLDVANPLTGDSNTDPNERNLELQSVGDVIASPDMQQRAAALLVQRGAPTAGYSVSSSTPSGDTQNDTYRNTVLIEGTSTDPELAAAAVNAFADAYVAWRKEKTQAQIGQAIAAIERKLRSYTKAEQASSDYLILQQRLSDLEILKATATGNYRVLTPATVPGTPFAPRPLRSAVLGFGLGLFAAIGLAFVLEQFDTRLRDPGEVAALLQRPILARIPKIPRRELTEDRLVCLAHPGGHAAESFRLLRTNLEFMSVDENVRSLAMTSCLQGEGKSVAIANLAVAMAVAGRRVVVVDGDLRRPQLQALFSLSNEAGVSTVVSGQTPLTSALQPFGPSVGVEAALALRGPDGNGSFALDVDGALDLRVLTSGPLPPNPGEIVSSQVFGDVIARLQRDADIVLVDSPAMLAVGDAVALCSRVDGFLFLVQLKATRRPQLERAAEQISRLPSRLVGIVLERGKEDSGGYYYYYGYTRDGGRQRTRKSTPTPVA